MQFQISSRRENRQRDTQVIKIRVQRKIFSKQFCFIRCRRQHLWPVEKRRYSRFTFIENTISNSPEVTRASLWEVMDSFVLLAYTSLAASRTLLQRLLACLNFTLESEIFLFGTNEKNDFYERWQQHKKLKTMEMRLDLIFSMWFI